MSTNTNPTCPTDCVFELPENSFDFCRSNIHTGEIEYLYLAGPDAECFTDVTSLAEWNARISLDSLDPDAIRRFRVVGDMPVATGDVVDISLGDKYYLEKDFVLNIELEDVSDENYDFMRYLECQFKAKAWVQTAGGDLFGGVCGLGGANGVNFGVGLQIERGQSSLHKMMWTLTWKSKFSPERATSPLA